MISIHPMLAEKNVQNKHTSRRRNGVTTFVLFNAVSEKLLDTTVKKLVNRRSTIDNDVPSEIQSLCVNDYVFKLKLKSFNLKDELENYTVTKIFSPDEELELQYSARTKEKGKNKVVDNDVNSKQKAEGFIDAKNNQEDGAASLENLENSEEELHDADHSVNSLKSITPTKKD